MLKRQYFIVNIFCWRYFIIPSWIVLSNNSLTMESFLILLSFSGNPGERSVFIFSYNSPLALASFSLLFPCLRHKLPASVSLQWHHSVSQFSSVTHSCLTLCDPMNRSTPDLPVHPPAPRVHPNPCAWVGDAIQPSHPLLSPSPPAPNPSQHQALFKWVSSSHQVAKVLEFQLQHQSFQWISRVNFL